MSKDPDFEKCLSLLQNLGTKMEIYTFEKQLLDSISDKLKNRIKQIKEISRKLGCSIGIVGGFVRDLLLCNPSEDVDFVVFEGDIDHLTSAITKELGGKIGKMSNQTLTTQVRFPDDIVIEFNSTRKERYEYPSRTPVVEVANIVEDLTRRDFTINTLIMFDQKYLDIFQGTEDLQNSIIQTTREPTAVFFEDYLRMFRAVRFACRLNFTIAERVKDGIKKNVKNILAVPQERILNELKLSFEYNPSKAFNLMKELGILETMFSEILNEKLDSTKFNQVNMWDKIQVKIDYLHSKKITDIYLYIAVILMEVQIIEDSIINKEFLLLQRVSKILRFYKFSNKEREKVLNYIKNRDLLLNLLSNTPTTIELRLMLRTFEPIIEELILLTESEIETHLNPPEIIPIIRQLGEVREKQDLIHFELAISGKDIIKEFNLEGEVIGDIKNRLILVIMMEQIPNTKEACLDYIRKKWIED